MLDFSSLDIFLRLLAAASFGLLIGSERTLAGKVAGMRTYALVSLGSALFVIVGLLITNAYLGRVNFDPARTLAGIITGIGFIGAGLIVMRENLLRGLTSAAGLWVASAVGVAAGFGFYQLALFSSVLTVLIFTAVWFLEYGLKQWWQSKSKTKAKKQREDSLKSKMSTRRIAKNTRINNE